MLETRNDWVRVTKEHPCPICGHHHNCSVGESYAWCGRVESDRQNRGGQYLHKLSDDIQYERPKYVPPKIVRRSWLGEAKAYHEAAMREGMLAGLAKTLGVSLASLIELRAGFDGYAWTFPERDAKGTIIGISRRFKNGRKGFMAGGGRGLTYSLSLPCDGESLLLVEGPSDVAAAITLGIPAIGRPSNRGGCELLSEKIGSFSHRKCFQNIIVLGENDYREHSALKPGIRQFHDPNCVCCPLCFPGQSGAIDTAACLQEMLDVKVKWMMPPEGIKDLRMWSQSKIEVKLDE